MRMGALVTIWLFSAASYLGFDGQVYAQSSYYQGKTIRLVQGREPGGSGDTRAKLVMPYLKKYLPGNPNYRK